MKPILIDEKEKCLATYYPSTLILSSTMSSKMKLHHVLPNHFSLKLLRPASPQAHHVQPLTPPHRDIWHFLCTCMNHLNLSSHILSTTRTTHTLSRISSFLHSKWTHVSPFACFDHISKLICSNVVKSYSKPLVELDEMVKRMVLEGLGLKNYIDEFLDLSSFLLRLTNYKAAQCEDMINTPGIGDHTDGNFLTIISQNQVNGLQILKKNGEWIDVNISSNSFVVLSGDSFMAWTNGRLHSPLHKVTMAGDSDRFSIQLFSDPKSDCTIKAQKNLWMRNTLYSSSHMTFLDILSFLRQKLDGKLAPMFSRFIVVYELLYFLKLQLAKGLSEKTSYDRSKVCETILNMLL